MPTHFGSQRSVSSPIHQGPLGGMVKRGGSGGWLVVVVVAVALALPRVSGREPVGITTEPLPLGELLLLSFSGGGGRIGRRHAISGHMGM